MADELTGTPPAAAPGPEPASAPAATPAPETYEITWNGKKIPIQGRDKVVEFAQKGYDYTQKLQALAEERKQAEAWRGEKAQIEQEVRAFLSDKEQLKKYLAELEGPAAPAQPGQDEILTRTQMMQILEQERQRTGQLTMKQLAQLRADFEVDRLAQRYTEDLDTHVKTLTGQFAELKSIPRLDRILKEAVAELGPKSIEEAKQFMGEIAQQYANQVREAILEGRKDGVAPAAGVLAKGIEPPGGAPVMPQAPAPFKGKISSDDFKRLVTEEILRSQAQK